MKNKIAAIIILILIVSCKKSSTDTIEQVLQSNNIEKVKQYSEELEKQKKEITTKIKLINKKIKELEPNQNIPLVTIHTTAESNFMHYLELQGSVKTKKNVLVYPETPGIITGVFVKAGQRVSKGQIIARIDNGGLSNQLQQAKSAAALAKTAFERQTRLWKQKIGSEIQYLQAKTNYEAQFNAVKHLEKTLLKYSIKAPFTGVVDQVMKETGVMVAPGRGSEICRVVNLSNMYIEVDIPESYITSIKRGKQVEVSFPVLGKTILSKVRQVGNHINPSNRTFKIEIDVPNKDRVIKPNLMAKLKVNDYTNNCAILIPENIVSENAKGEQYVYGVEKRSGKKGFVSQFIIKTGKTQGGQIEVLDGLKAGIEIIKEGARTVQKGQEVEISNFKVNQ